MRCNVINLGALQETGKKKKIKKCSRGQNVLGFSPKYWSSSKNPGYYFSHLTTQEHPSLDPPFLVNAFVFPTLQPQFVTQAFR